MKKAEKSTPSVEVLDRAVQALADLLAELGACPPQNDECLQRNTPVNIGVCARCLRTWAETKGKAQSS
jgi:hypothetical protein